MPLPEALREVRQPRRGRRAGIAAAALLLLVGICSVDDRPDPSVAQLEPAAADGAADTRPAPGRDPRIERSAKAATKTKLVKKRSAPQRRRQRGGQRRRNVASAVPAGIADEVQTAVVEKHVDGDTLWVRVDEPDGPLTAGASHSIRLLAIDTPETKHPTKGVECGGLQASRFTAENLPVGATVFLLADREDTDRYGRFLRYAWTEDGVFFNRLLVRAGHARAVLYEPNDRFIGEMRAAERKARNAKRGIWSGVCEATAPAPAPARGAVSGQQRSGCAPGYDPCVPSYPPDVNCADVNGPITVTGPDPHALDGDDDGVACES